MCLPYRSVSVSGCRCVLVTQCVSHCGKRLVPAWSYQVPVLKIITFGRNTLSARTLRSIFKASSEQKRLGFRLSFNGQRIIYDRWATSELASSSSTLVGLSRCRPYRSTNIVVGWGMSREPWDSGGISFRSCCPPFCLWRSVLCCGCLWAPVASYS